MVRIAIFVLLVGLVYLIARSYFSPSQKEGRVPGSMEMVQDPNCQIYIPRAEAIQRVISEKAYFFCSGECADAYEKSHMKS